MQTSMVLEGKDICSTYSKKFVSLGELFITNKPTHVWTVLGSCVSVVLHNPRMKVSALCHAQLTEKGIVGETHQKESIGKEANDDYRYIACSIKYMLNQLFAMGIHKNEIYASVYGGASLIAAFSHQVGAENAEAASKVLGQSGIRIVHKDVGGIKSRTIRHFSDTGVTEVKVL
jgi:chemotaxis protein CheD